MPSPRTPRDRDRLPGAPGVVGADSRFLAPSSLHSFGNMAHKGGSGAPGESLPGCIASSSLHFADGHLEANVNWSSRSIPHEDSIQNRQVLETLNKSLLSQVTTIQRNIDEIRQFQEMHQHHVSELRESVVSSLTSSHAVLQDFIKEHLRALKYSLVSEVQSSKDECLDSGTNIRRFLETCDDRWAHIHDTIVTKETTATKNDKDAIQIDEHAIQSGGTSVGAPHGIDIGDLTSPAPSQAQQKGVPPVKHQKAILQHRKSEVETWSRFQHEVDEADPNSMYGEVMQRRIEKRSLWHHLFQTLGFGGYLDLQPPNTCMAQMTEHGCFVAFQTLLILSNTFIMGYETDLAMKASLANSKEDLPKWLAKCDLIFNILFGVELLFRILALRSWFWVAPGDWAWNLFDVALVAFSLVSDFLTGFNYSFIRTFRIFRAIRVVRIIRVLRFFRQLRKMLFAILACLSSLAWAFLFLAVIMFMFSIFFLQGAVQKLEDLTYNIDEDRILREDIEYWYGGVASTMLSLLAAVTGGADWLDVRKPIAQAGQLYAAAFVIYTLFVTVGVMNVLTVIFLSSADEFLDLPLIIQNEQIRVDGFCEQMLELFGELDMSHTGLVDWPTFAKALKRDSVRAYLASMQLEPTHIRLLFDLLDEKQTGRIDVNDFVMGMVRLKGEAKAIDARIIERELGMMLPLVEIIANAAYANGSAANLHV